MLGFSIINYLKMFRFYASTLLALAAACCDQSTSVVAQKADATLSADGGLSGSDSAAASDGEGGAATSQPGTDGSGDVDAGKGAADAVDGGATPVDV